jgi:hypothetical protein
MLRTDCQVITFSPPRPMRHIGRGGDRERRTAQAPAAANGCSQPCGQACAVSHSRLYAHPACSLDALCQCAPLSCPGQGGSEVGQRVARRPERARARALPLRLCVLWCWLMEQPLNPLEVSSMLLGPPAPMAASTPAFTRTCAARGSLQRARNAHPGPWPRPQRTRRCQHHRARLGSWSGGLTGRASGLGSALPVPPSSAPHQCR